MGTGNQALSQTAGKKDINGSTSAERLAQV